jgi:hypothetical protein
VGGAGYVAGKRRAQPDQPAAAAPPPTSAPPPQAPAPPPQAPAGGLSPEAVEQLQSLAQLHDQGILTDQEFEQQKAKVLGS